MAFKSEAITGSAIIRQDCSYLRITFRNGLNFLESSFSPSSLSPKGVTLFEISR